MYSDNQQWRLEPQMFKPLLALSQFSYHPYDEASISPITFRIFKYRSELIIHNGANYFHGQSFSFLSSLDKICASTLWEARRKSQYKWLQLKIIKNSFWKKSVFSDPLLLHSLWLHAYQKDFSCILMRWYHETYDPKVSIALKIYFQLEYTFNVIFVLVFRCKYCFFIHLKEVVTAFLLGNIKNRPVNQSVLRFV